MLSQAIREETANGFTMLACPHQAAEHIELAVALPAGSACESGSEAGLANFAALGILLGTADHDFDAFSEELDSFGGSLQARCGGDNAVWRGSCLPADLPRLLELIHAALESPRFADEDVARLRSQILTGIDEREQDTMRLARRVAQELAYGRAHPYGRPTNGYREVVEAIGPEQLTAFWQRWYRPAGGIVTVVGPGDAPRLVAALRRGLESWTPSPPSPSSPSSPLPEVERRSAARRDLNLPGKTQTDIAMIVPALARHEPDFEALSLVNLILGRLGLGGRLGQKVREELGLAYYCFSAVVGAVGPGPWLLAAGVNPARLGLALESIEAEIVRIREVPVEPRELQAAVGYARGSLEVDLEEPSGLVEALLRLETHSLGLDYVAKYRRWLDGVDASMLLQAAHRYIDPARIALVTAGPGQG